MSELRLSEPIAHKEWGSRGRTRVWNAPLRRLSPTVGYVVRVFKHQRGGKPAYDLGLVCPSPRLITAPGDELTFQRENENTTVAVSLPQSASAEQSLEDRSFGRPLGQDHRTVDLVDHVEV